MTVTSKFSNSRTDAQLARIQQLLDGLDPFFRVRTTMPARYVQAFLLVAQKEGLSVAEYAKRADQPMTTMSRILLDMSERGRSPGSDDGAGLVEGSENPMDMREKLYALTPKGRALLASIMKGVK